MITNTVSCADAAITQLVHHGMIYVPTGYTYSPDMYRLDQARARGVSGRLQSLRLEAHRSCARVRDGWAARYRHRC